MFKIPWRNKARFTGLEIEGGYVKLAQSEGSGRLRKIVRLIVKKLPSASEKDTIEALRTIAAELKGQIGIFSLCIPRHKATVRFLRFPTVNEKEIEGMVKLQSAKELPFSREEIISDYLVSERTKDGYAKVALAIVHQDVINGYLAILNKAGLEPARITLSTEALLNWYRISAREKKLQGDSILVDLDSDNTEIVVFHNSYLGFTRGLNFGTTQLRAEDNLKNKLVQEIRRTIEEYGKQESSSKIERILVGEIRKVGADLQAFLTQELNLPCQGVASLKNLALKKEVSAVSDEHQISLLRVLGQVQEIKGRRLNLLPAALRQKQEIKLRRKTAYKTSILLSAIFLLSLAVFVKMLHNKQLRIFYLDREIKQTQPQAKAVEQMLKKIELIEQRGKIEGSCIDVLRQLHKLIPAEISLASFNYDEEKRMLTLRGISAEMSEILKLINTLEKSAYFKNVQLKYVSEKKAKAGGLTEFRIECALEK